MNTQILIVSYSKDIPWLEYCLRSISKFCQGFGGTRLLVPQQEQHLFTDLAPKHGVVLLTYDRHTPPIKWHLHHQLEKCRADQWCPDADFILHTDSDCIFIEPITPEEYIHDGKPVLLIEKFSRLGPNNPWKPVVDSVMGMDAQYETMRRHPAVHYRALYSDLREHIERLHGQSFEDYVLALKPNFPWGFTEFNMLGQVAIGQKWRDRYCVIDVETQERPPEKLIQFWSGWGVDGIINNDGPHGNLGSLKGRTPRQVMEQLPTR